MPSFVVNTNVPRANIPHDFLLDLSKVVAKSTGKPESVSTRLRRNNNIIVCHSGRG